MLHFVFWISQLSELNLRKRKTDFSEKGSALTLLTTNIPSTFSQ